MGFFFWWNSGPPVIKTEHTGELPASTPLQATPRQAFAPTTRKGYWNIDIVDDFTLPATKSLTFCGAGRNLHVEQDWAKLFRRGFSSIDRTRMVDEEYRSDYSPKPDGWKSRLKPSQRALWIPGQYFSDQPFMLAWGKNGDLANQTWFKRPTGDPLARQSMYSAASELGGGCYMFNDCPPGKMLSSFSKIFVDAENEGSSHRQDHANLYVFLYKTIRENIGPDTEVGSIGPVPVNGFGYSRRRDYNAGPHWLWDMPAKHTSTSRQFGMPDDIIGKSFSELIDFQMPGVYFLYPEFDYSIDHSDNGSRHWLASVLHEQEVNGRFSPKKRIAWQWLFNTQSAAFPNSLKAEHPTPPMVAEGLAIFYWFTGAYGAILWDDYSNLLPDQPAPTDPAEQGLGNDRNYACYEHYVHGLWRLFKHHGDLFNGQEKYLNTNTECSYDNGKTWYKLNPNQLKTGNRPFVRAIVNGNQVLVAATMPYAKKDQVSQVKFRYVENGYQFYTDITLKGDEIFLGRATMASAGASKAATASL
ncbi:hypothetical protein [Tellurirhabdus bombi]|uniref:hypothetical protein n=1 Tax=Tellurirhabdus bombi TaxID=2907205 RepID=UPI001F1E2B67|nr:hypothetical protein [Tellurirhabdus bombi]